ncbi:MAG: hypothetical protein WDO70_04430 [Alphaproteobacteria bacterium]
MAEITKLTVEQQAAAVQEGTYAVQCKNEFTGIEDYVRTDKATTSQRTAMAQGILNGVCQAAPQP